MKIGWSMKTLGEIAEVKGGKRIPKGDKLQSEPTMHPYITVSDFTDDGTIDLTAIRYVTESVFEKIKNYRISSKDIYLSIAGTIGKTGYVPPELDGANLTENACKLVLRAEINRNFLYYFTKSDEFIEQAVGNTRTAAQPKLALERLKTIRLCVPSLTEQQRIVAILDKAFEAIGTAKTNATRNLQNARAIFESQLQSVFAERGKGWVKHQLASLCNEITVGHVGSMKMEYKASGVPFLRSQNIRPFEVSMDNAMFIDERFHRSLKKSQLRPGDLAIVRTGYPGTAAVIPAELPDSNCSDLVIVRPSKEVDPHFLAAFFNSAFGKQLVLGNIVGAAQKHFNITAAKAVMLHVPPMSDQRAIIKMVDTLRGETQRLASVYERKLAALDALKKSLLYRAFAGELTAGRTSELLEAVA